ELCQHENLAFAFADPVQKLLEAPNRFGVFDPPERAGGRLVGQAIDVERAILGGWRVLSLARTAVVVAGPAGQARKPGFQPRRGQCRKSRFEPTSDARTRAAADARPGKRPAPRRRSAKAESRVAGACATRTRNARRRPPRTSPAPTPGGRTDRGPGPSRGSSG